MDFRVNLSVEQSSIRAVDPCETVVMVSLACPVVETEERRTRAPIDLCCVVDRSGSMAGRKLELTKKAIQFLVEQLKEGDRITVVAFDTAVSTVVKLCEMDSRGKQATLAAVSTIREAQATNLSGGLFQGLSILYGREKPREVSAILLLTDGLANRGVTDTQAIVKGVQNILKGMPPCAIFSFGFGDDHDPKMLTAISDAAHGLYYYVKREDEIPQAFSECIGGLLSVAAQNVVVTVSCVAASKIKPLSKYPCTEVAQNSLQLSLGDMYSEEQKDLLFQVTLLPTEEQTPQEVAKVTVHCFSVATFSMRSHDGVFHVICSKCAENSPPNPSVDKQKNRVWAAEALHTAAELADQNRFAEARETIQAAITRTERSVAASDSFCAALVQDMRKALVRLQDKTHYSTGGSSFVRNMRASHHQQRSSETAWDADSPQLAQQSYTTSSKLMSRRYVLRMMQQGNN